MCATSPPARPPRCAADRFDGKAFNLTGPEALGYGDAAAILSAVSGRHDRYLPVDDSGLHRDPDRRGGASGSCEPS